MKTILLILSLLTTTCAIAQITLQDVEDRKIYERIQFIKAKTDSFLLTHFRSSVRPKFELDFTSCGYFVGELRSIYQFLNSDKPAPDDLNALTHYYNFYDRRINLKTDIGIWFYQHKNVDMQFQTTSDSLKFAAIDKIYNKGLLKKIVRNIIELKLKSPYTVIQIDEKRRAFDVILRDKSLPHNFFIT